MDPIYISTKGDDIVTLAKRIECEGYGLGVVELSGQLLPTNGKKNQLLSMFRCFRRSFDQ